MKILCCFKIVSDLDPVMEKDWAAADSSGVDLSYVKKIINCFDEAGIETALRIKESAEKQGETVSVTAITVGGGQYEAFFKNLFAVGIGRIIQGRHSNTPMCSPDRLSEYLSELAGDSKYDLVITGTQSEDGNNGLTPYYLAKRFGLPCISNVSELQYSGSVLRVSCDAGDGTRRATVNAPALYAVSNSVNPYLRMATLRQKLATSKLSAEIFELDEAPTGTERDPVFQSFSRERSGRSCVFIEGESCAEKAAKLLKAYPEVRGR